LVHGDEPEQYGLARRRRRQTESDVLTTLDRHYLLELTINVLFTFAVITAVAVFAIAGVVFFRNQDVDLLLFLSLCRLMLVQALSFLLPLAMLIAVVFVYGRAAADHEVTTLKASGIHPYRLLWPGAALALVLCALTFEVETRWSPRAQHQMRVLPASEENMKRLLEKRIKSGERSVDFGDKKAKRKLVWEKIGVRPEGGVLLEHVLLETSLAADAETGAEAETTMVRADRGIVRFDSERERVVLRLEQPRSVSGMLHGMEHDAIEFLIDVVPMTERGRLKLQTLPELVCLHARSLETAPLSGKSLLRYAELVEVDGRIHQRLARAASPLVFLLLGAPLALVFRSGNRMVAFLLASLIAMFVYYPVEQVASVLRDRQLASPLVACWSGNSLLTAIGVGLLLFVVKR